MLTLHSNELKNKFKEEYANIWEKIGGQSGEGWPKAYGSFVGDSIIANKPLTYLLTSHSSTYSYNWTTIVLVSNIICIMINNIEILLLVIRLQLDCVKNDRIISRRRNFKINGMCTSVVAT